MNNEKHQGRIVRYTAEEIDEMLARGESMTDWERVRNMTEEELEASIDVEEEGEFNLDHAEVFSNIVHIQPDILVWFRHQGPDHETRINQVLRSYVETQLEKERKGRRAS